MESQLQEEVRKECEEYIATTTNPRHQRMIENLRDHILFELSYKPDEIALLFSADAELHNYSFDPELHLKGRDAIRELYATVASALEIVDCGVERLLVSDAGLAALMRETAVATAEFLLKAGVAIPGDQPVAANARYAITARIAAFRKFDGELASEWVLVPGRPIIEPYASGAGLSD